MKIQNRFWRMTKKLYTGLLNRTEDDYYENLFIGDSEWNKPHPNEDEQCRLTAVEKHLQFAGIKRGSDSRVLEVGCGRGWLTNILNDYGQATGIDPVEKVIKYASELFPASTFYPETPQGFSRAFPDKKFDLIVSTEVIEHVPDSAKSDFVKSIYTLLADNGHVIITTPRKEAQSAYLNEYGEPDQPVEEWMTEEEVVRLFENNGFVKRNNINIGLPYSKTLTNVPIYQTWLFRRG